MEKKKKEAGVAHSSMCADDWPEEEKKGNDKKGRSGKQPIVGEREKGREIGDVRPPEDATPFWQHSPTATLQVRKQVNHLVLVLIVKVLDSQFSFRKDETVHVNAAPTGQFVFTL